MGPLPRIVLPVRARPLLVAGLLAVLAGAVVGLVGCGADPYPGQPDEGTLRISFVSEMNGFDPVRANEDIRTQCVLNVYDALYQYAYLKRPYELEPCLAAALPEVSADGKVVRIRLKPGIRYVDDPCFRATGGKGREVVASDVVFCLKRLMDMRSDTKGSWLLGGKVEGLDAFSKASEAAPEGPNRHRYGGAEGFPEVPGLVAVDDHTVEFRLVEPYPQLQWVLAMPYTSIYPPEAVAEYGVEFLNHAVGTGPFRVAEYRPGQRLVLVRNPGYREERYPAEASEQETKAGLLEDAGKRLPQVDRVVATVIKESQPRWLWFEAGYLDVIRVPKDSYDVAIGPAPARDLKPRLADRGVVLWKEPQLEIIYDGFNMQDPVVGVGEKAKAIRRAISLATDYAWAAEYLYNGLVEDMQGPIPRDTAEWDPAFVNPWKPAQGETRAQTLARAREVLEKAGLPGGQGVPEITVDVLDSSTDDDHFKAWKRDLAEIGIRLRPYKTDWQGLMHRVDKGETQLWGQAWFGDYPDAQNFLQCLYGPTAPDPNGTRYQNPEFDREYAGTASMQPGPERTKIYRHLQQIAVDDAAWVIRSRRIFPYVRHAWLHGFRPSDLSTKWWKYARIDGALRRDRTDAWNQGRPLVPALLASAFVVGVVGTLLLGRRRRRGW